MQTVLLDPLVEQGTVMEVMDGICRVYCLWEIEGMTLAFLPGSAADRSAL